MESPAKLAIGETAHDVGGTETVRKRVSIQLEHLLTSRGCIVGCGGAGKTNSARLIATQLLESGDNCFVVDTSGEYSALAADPGVVHVGQDDDCDLQLSSTHADTFARRAVEEGVSICFDVSTYSSVTRARSHLAKLATATFKCARDRSTSVLFVIESIDSYLPADDLDECGSALHTLCTQGASAGIGVCGITRQPILVHDDFLTTCEWALCHRLGADELTPGLEGLLDGQYVTNLDSLPEGSAIFATHWDESIRPVDVFSVEGGSAPTTDPPIEGAGNHTTSSGAAAAIVREFTSDSTTATELPAARTATEIDDPELDERIECLEADLEAASDVVQTAKQFVEEFNRTLRNVSDTDLLVGERLAVDQSTEQSSEQSTEQSSELIEVDPSWGESADNSNRSNGTDKSNPTGGFGDVFAATVDCTDARNGAGAGGSSSNAGSASNGGPAEKNESANTTGSWTDQTDESDANAGTDCSGWSAELNVTSKVQSVPPSSGDAIEFSADTILAEMQSIPDDEGFQPPESDWNEQRKRIDGEVRKDPFLGGKSSKPASITTDDLSGELGANGQHGRTVQNTVDRYTDVPESVKEVGELIDGLSEPARVMFAEYAENGPMTPLNVHFEHFGEATRTAVYAYNRELRRLGLIEHVGRGHYDTCISDRLQEKLDQPTEEGEIRTYLRTIQHSVAL